MDGALTVGISLAHRPESGDDADLGRDRTDRRGSARADRRRRPRRVRGSLHALRAAGARARAAPARRPRPRRGRGAGDLRLRLALGPQLPPRARPRRAVAVRRRAERDRRPRPRARRAAGRAARRRSRDEPGPAEHAEQSWLAWRVHRAIEELPEHEREVLELAYWSGLSQSEIAEFLDIPLGTVKTRTRCGLRRLSEALGEELT